MDLEFICTHQILECANDDVTLFNLFEGNINFITHW